MGYEAHLNISEKVFVDRFLYTRVQKWTHKNKNVFVYVNCFYLRVGQRVQFWLGSSLHTNPHFWQCKIDGKFFQDPDAHQVEVTSNKEPRSDRNARNIWYCRPAYLDLYALLACIHAVVIAVIVVVLSGCSGTSTGSACDNNWILPLGQQALNLPPQGQQGLQLLPLVSSCNRCIPCPPKRRNGANCLQLFVNSKRGSV